MWGRAEKSDKKYRYSEQLREQIGVVKDEKYRYSEPVN
jgi:hypothetical protein